MSRAPQQFGVHNLERISQSLAADSGALRVRLKHQSFNRAYKFELETEFTAAPGITVIVGHSGAGKTTILRCIAGLSQPAAGRIAIGDRVLFDSSERISLASARRRVGFVFQDLALFPHL